ncbi:MAG: hypothetical protein AAB457_01990 [Patescibacteria group bacterium]
MKKTTDFPKLPDRIKVSVIKGESGALLARLPDYEVFTESDNLNDLVFQVNDLIYTFFDVPKKYHDDIFFQPERATQDKLVKIASGPSSKSYSQFNIRSYYSPEMIDVLYRTHPA